jgi:ElaB/YqjD/DUF883 family membrane-anchored ribosome-binding protein
MRRAVEACMDETPISQRARALPDQAKAKIEGARRYIKDTDLDHAASDLDVLVKQHPWAAVGAAVFTGWILGRILRRD